MIIFGTRGITYRKDGGRFFCPECDGEQPYDRKRVRRFFTLYFIPLIPLNLLAEYIECPRCGGTYREDILSCDPRAAKEKVDAEFHRAVRRVMIGMMLADGNIEDSEVESIRDIYGQLANSEVTEAQIRREIEHVEAAGSGVLDDLREVGAYLNEHGKELVMKAAFMVAAADGTVQEEESILLNGIAGAIGMSPAHFRGIMAEFREEP